MRLRFAEYFAAVSDVRYKAGWEKYRDGLEKRRDNLRNLINQKERDFDKIRTGRSLLGVNEQTELAQLDRELTWYFAELGYVRQDSNVTAPFPRTLDDIGKDFNGPLLPVTAAALLKALGPPTKLLLSDASSSSSSSSPSVACIPIDGEKLDMNLDEYVIDASQKIKLIKPAADSLRRIMSKLNQDDPELSKVFSLVPTQCAIYNTSSKTFDISSWLVTVTFAGKNSSAASAFGFSLFGVSFLNPGFDPFALASMEKIARYFRDEQWYWRGGDRVKRPYGFVVSASLFEQWVSKGDIK